MWCVRSHWEGVVALSGAFRRVWWSCKEVLGGCGGPGRSSSSWKGVVVLSGASLEGVMVLS